MSALELQRLLRAVVCCMGQACFTHQLGARTASASMTCQEHDILAWLPSA